MSNKFMESVLETRKEMIFHNALCTLLEQLSRKSVLKLRMLPRRYLEEMGHTSHSSWKGIISPMLQAAESPQTLSRKSEIMFTPSCTLKSTLWRKALLLLAALVKETPIAVQAATQNSTTAKIKMSARESCIRK